MGKDGRRPIPHGNCTWCSHKPHQPSGCTTKITTSTYNTTGKRVNKDIVCLCKKGL